MILLDTHVLLWSVTDSHKLGQASRLLLESKSKTDPYYVSSITAWEVTLLAKRGRLHLGESVQEWFANAMLQPAWRSIAIDNETAIESINLPGNLHNDPADRFLIATARINGFTLFTADRAILEYSKSGHVKVFDASK